MVALNCVFIISLTVGSVICWPQEDLPTELSLTELPAPTVSESQPALAAAPPTPPTKPISELPSVPPLIIPPTESPTPTDPTSSPPTQPPTTYPDKDEYTVQEEDELEDEEETNYADTCMYLDKNVLLQQLGLPWVYVIMPVVEVDVYYINQEQHGVEGVGFDIPVETFAFDFEDLFEIGEMALGDLIFGDIESDYSDSYSYQHTHYVDYNGGYQPEAAQYDTADELYDKATMEYPAGIDYNGWVDWLFKLPTEDVLA